MHYSTIVFGLLALSGVANTVPIDENHQGDVTTISVASSLQARGPTSTKATTTGKTSTAAADSSTGKATSGAASNTSGTPASTVSSAAAASTSAGTNSKGNSTTSGGANSKGNSTVGGATNSTNAGNSTSCPLAREPASNDIKNKYIITYNGKDIKTLHKEIQGYKDPGGKCPKVQTSEPVFLVDKKYQIYIGHLDDLIVKGVLDPLKKKKELEYAPVTLAEAEVDSATTVQETAPWSLARISQEKPLQDLGTDNARLKEKNWKFPHKEDWGKDILIYVVDTGVRATHAEFGGRVEEGHTISGITGPATSDNDGHGTGVASVAAGKTIGIARQATIIPVKMTDSGTAESGSVARALDWVKNDIAKRQGAKVVVNVSWTLHRNVANEAIIQVLSNVYKAHVVASAGNKGVNDCNNRIKTDNLVAMVGATDAVDKSGYNYGPCVTMNAPGKGVWVAKKDGDDAYRGGTGTSYATPLVAGVVAAELTTQDLSPSQMKTLLESERSTTGITNIRDNQPDRILLTSLAKQPGNAVQ